MQATHTAQEVQALRQHASPLIGGQGSCGPAKVESQ